MPAHFMTHGVSDRRHDVLLEGSTGEARQVARIEYVIHRCSSPLVLGLRLPSLIGWLRGLLGLDLFSPGGLFALPILEGPVSPVHAYRVKLHDIPFRDRAGTLAEATPLHLILSAFGGHAGQTDLGDSSGDADREGLTHLDAGRHQVV